MIPPKLVSGIIEPLHMAFLRVTVFLVSLYYVRTAIESHDLRLSLLSRQKELFLEEWLDHMLYDRLFRFGTFRGMPID